VVEVRGCKGAGDCALLSFWCAGDARRRGEVVGEGNQPQRFSRPSPSGHSRICSGAANLPWGLTSSLIRFILTTTARSRVLQRRGSGGKCIVRKGLMYVMRVCCERGERMNDMVCTFRSAPARKEAEKQRSARARRKLARRADIICPATHNLVEEDVLPEPLPRARGESVHPEGGSDWRQSRRTLKTEVGSKGTERGQLTLRRPPSVHCQTLGSPSPPLLPARSRESSDTTRYRRPPSSPHPDPDSRPPAS